MPGGHRGEDARGPGRALRAEAATDEGRDDRDPLRGQLEQARQDVPYRRRPLTGVVHGQSAVLPAGRGRVGLHRMVVQGAHGVRGVHPHRGGGEGRGEVAALAHRRMAAVGLLRRVEVRVVGAQQDVVVLHGVVDVEDLGGLARDLRRVGDDHGHVPAAVRDPVVLEQQERRVVRLAEPGRVLVGEHGAHAGALQNGFGVHGGDPAAGDGGGHGAGVEAAGRRPVDGVAGLARHLLPGVAADGPRRRTHELAGHGAVPPVVIIRWCRCGTRGRAARSRRGCGRGGP